MTVDKKSYLEQMQDKIAKAAEVVKDTEDIEIAYIAGRLDAKLDALIAQNDNRN